MPQAWLAEAEPGLSPRCACFCRRADEKSLTRARRVRKPPRIRPPAPKRAGTGRPPGRPRSSAPKPKYVPTGRPASRPRKDGSSPVFISPEVLAQAQSLMAEGQSLRATATQLGIGYSGLSRRLKKERQSIVR